MAQMHYRTGEFAARAAVSTRTLRYYDQIGLLAPAAYSDSGYRLYTDADLVTLQQILALKFLGFSLTEIKGYLRAGPEDLQTGLARQKGMLFEKRAQIDAVVAAIEEVEQLAQADQVTWSAITHIIEVTQMEQQKDWRDKYFTPEQRQIMDDLSEQSYSDAAKETMAGWGTWTEEDQRRVDAQYAAIAADLKRLVAEGKDPADPAVQAVAKRQLDLISQFTQNDPEIEAGLQTWWQNYQALPADQKPVSYPWGEAEHALLQQALAIYRQQAGE